MPKFVPRQRKHKVLAREKARKKSGQEDATPLPEADSNAVEIIPEAQRAARDARKAQLKEELKGSAIVSGKKAKRLEKYIDNKLKKDENRALLTKLAQSKIDTSLFQSSRSLGQGKETKRQALSRALREKDAGVSQGDNDDMLFEPRRDVSDDEPFELLPNQTKITSPRDIRGESSDLPIESSKPIEPPTLLAEIGSGLKRPLELDDEGRPIIQKRQKRGGVKSKISLRPQVTLQARLPDGADNQSGEEWDGLSSDASTTHDSTSPTGDISNGGSEEEETENGESVSELSSEDESSDEENSGMDGKQRSSAFKAWAHEQRNQALGYNPIENGSSLLDIPKPTNFKPRAPEVEPLPQELLPTREIERKAFSVSVVRPQALQEARMKLPVVTEEQKIMEAIHNNNVVIICGATGSGKTTQVPQFLFEAGYGSPSSPTPGMIGVTQPRKVAAVSMSKRVGEELGDRSDTVAYQIRFEGTTNQKTAIKFMTDGVLLREVANDIALRKYSAVIIDEAHERSVNTDILIGMLSRVVKLREEISQDDANLAPLKLIIMSATLRVDDLTRNPILFTIPPPVLEIEGRQHPVTIHFARQTRHDYVEEVFKKISRGHRKLPPGGFLVFLTGHDEISRLSKKLKMATGGLNPAPYPKVRISANDAPLEVEDIDFGEANDNSNDDIDGLPFIDEEYSEDDEGEFDISEEIGTGPLKMHILPLYSLLPTKEQMRVFEDPPENSRQIILATNVAETSLTIPGIRYVFDCGRSKERKYNKATGVQSYEIGWISKASANQRSGRAGRTGPGHCYRLYSSAVYERDFAAFAEPELLRMPIEGVVLQLKAMRLQHVINFPFPTPPDRLSIAKAEKMLQYLSAITPDGRATQIGSTMARFPLPPRFARILLIGHLHDCLPYTIALVAGLSVAEIFIPENQAIPALAATNQAQAEGRGFRTPEETAAETRQAQARQRYREAHRNFRALDGTSDALKVLQAVGEFAHEPTEDWCARHFVRLRALQEAQALRRQITDLLRRDVPALFAGGGSPAATTRTTTATFAPRLARPSARQVAALKQMVAAGFIDQVAIRADLAPSPPSLPGTAYRKPRRAIDVPYIPLQPMHTHAHAHTRRHHHGPTGAAGDDDDDDGGGGGGDKAVYIHPSSVLAHLSPQECPEYVVYAGLQRAASSAAAAAAAGDNSSSSKRPRTRMLALTDVTGAQLAGLAKGTPLLTYGKPIKEVRVPGSEDDSPGLRDCWVVPYLRADGAAGLQGWPLPVAKVHQRKVSGKGWVVE